MEPRTAGQAAGSRPAPPDAHADDVRRNVHRAWAAVAASWGEYAEYADARGAAVTAKMLELSAPTSGERLLELACGAGGVGLAAATLVAPGGEVVMSDVAAEMTAIAALRAATLGITNVRTRELDLEDIHQPDEHYDVVLCREGLMFAVDPARAVREIRRVLRPGGRTAVAVWGQRQRNPWLGLVFDAVSAQLGTPVPPPGVPGPFSLDEPTTLSRLLVEAGFTEVDVSELPTPLRDGSFDQWWARTSALAGPLASRLSALSPQAAQELRERLQTAVQPYQTSAGLEFPGVSIIASGRRPH